MSDKFMVEAPDVLRLKQVFQDLEYMDQKRILIGALKKATAPTVQLAKQNVRKVSGNLRNSIGALVMQNEIAVVVGARKRRGFKGHHGIIVEEGTESRKYIAPKTHVAYSKDLGRFFMIVKGKEYKTGRMKATGRYAGFLRKAASKTEAWVMDTIGDIWNAEIEKYHRKNELK